MPLTLRIAPWCLVAAASVLPPAWAGRPVPVYDVTVAEHGGDQNAALQDAMREVLVRATGRQDAATAPALSALVAHASDYLRSSRPAGEGQLEVAFDDAAVEKQIAAAGWSVWERDRPFTIVVLSPAPTGAADDEARRALEEVAEQRGLPISLVPMPVTDQNGAPLTADVLLNDARRLGGDVVLLGRAGAAAPGPANVTTSGPAEAPAPSSAAAAGAGSATATQSAPPNAAAQAPANAVPPVPAAAAAPGAARGTPPSPAGGTAPGTGASPPGANASPTDEQWQWTLITGLATQSWNGSLDAGINGAADAMARVEGSSLPLAEENALVRVSGVGTLADYATIESMLGELPGVRRSGLMEADGTTATFRVLIRGGAQAIARALANAQHLTRIGADATSSTAPAAVAADAPADRAGVTSPELPLAYQYHP